jgi:serine/threonine protein kinase/regulator of sirC expression with transglutaminase-like and TPR domain
MSGSSNGRSSLSLDEVVEAYEVARARGDRADLAVFLPPPEHPEYLAFLCELVRVDLEYSWQDGRPNRLDHYRGRFPELFREGRWVQEIAFEEFRLRRQAGEDPSPLEYRRRYGADTLDWPSSFLDSLDGDFAEGSAPGDREAQDGAVAGDLMTAATAYREYRDNRSGDAARLEAALTSHGVPPGPAELFLDLDRSDSNLAYSVARAVTGFPPVGSTFLGFRLESELGRGAFGRVYLASQGDLANRLVALKISADVISETRALAQLRHTNIVPIYSVHRSGPLQAICMPYLGVATFADILRELKRSPTLPDSGAGLLSSRRRRSSACEPRPEGSRGSRSSGEECTTVAASSLPELRANSQIENLGGLGYVQAVLWLVARLADGLAHAHERGILHRDLKPANILLGDDGEPLLLDFNLAADTKLRSHASAALLGGTLPYMAPEHIEALKDGRRLPDARSDIYSLGAILFELLTGQPPFPVRTGPVREMLPVMIAERKAPIPRVRAWNSKVSPAVESIVGRCLHPEPAQRYRSARELHEDLQRQLDDLPLKYATEPSLRERLGKWARRHRRLTSMTTLALIAAGLVVALTAGFLVRQRHLARLEAAEASHRLAADVRQADFLLGSRDAPRGQIEEGLALCGRAVAHYRVLDDPAWTARPAVALLPPDERDQLRREIGHLLLLDARALIWQAESTTDPAQRAERLDLATLVHDRAGVAFGDDAPSRALLLQRSDLSRLGGREDEARRLREKAETVPPRTTADRYWDVLDRIDHRGRPGAPIATQQRQEILATLQDISRGDLQNFVNYLLLGNANVRLGQLPAAISCYSTGIALRPDLPWAYFNRGLARLDLRDYAGALADFDSVIAMRPDMVEALINRSVARMGSGDFSGAVSDLDQVLERPDAPVQALLRRATARERLGDREGAARDRALGLRRRPDDELSWIVRGLTRLDDEPNGALADFDAALTINPRSKSALENKAFVLAERLGRPEEAIRVYDTTLLHHPDDAKAIGPRGVYHARLGRREAALADARAALALGEGAPTTQEQAFTIYQVAGIYALTSRQQPQDRREAVRLLALALRKDDSWLRALPDDHDFDPIRDQPEFHELLRAWAAFDGAIAPGPQAQGGEKK